MRINPFSVSCLLLTITCATIIIIALITRRNTYLHRVWLWFNIAVFTWGLTSFLVTQTADIHTAEILWKISIIGVIYTAVFFFHIVYVFCKIPKRFLIAAYIQSFIGVIAALTGLLTHLQFIFDSFYYAVSFKWGYPFIYSTWVVMILYGQYTLFKTALRSNGILRIQLFYFFAGTCIGFSGGAVNFLPVFGFKIYPYSNFLISAYCIIATYAIFRYRLMDIKVALTRAGVFVIVYLLVLGVPFGLAVWGKGWLMQVFGQNWFWVPMSILVGLATAGPFTYIYLSRRTEARFLREERRAHELLKQASRGMVHIHNKKKLIDLIDHITTKTLKLENGQVFLVDENSGNFKLSAVRFKSKYHYSEIISRDNPLIQKLSVMEEPLVHEEVKLKKQELENKPNDRIHEIESQMQKLKAAVIVPSISNGRLVAFLVLGEKTSKRMYSQEDLSTLWALSYQAALAIDNTFLYEKEKMRLAEQSRRQALADMAPGASHQFNNRLTTISVTADNLLDLMKNDSQGFSKEQLIDHVSEELGIIRDEVVKGKQITAAILQKAKVKLEFDKVDIAKVIQNAINLIRLRRTRESLGGAREPGFIFNYPKDIPLLNLCEGTMQDVFENMFNNAYDAIVIHDKRKIEPLPYQGEIAINISRKEGSVIIAVEDNGIGIQKDNLHKLFTDLFTTKATAEKGVVGGSGLGLGVMRSFVEGHGGAIAVDSEYTKWTRFTITLPVDFKPPK
ncbi:MAG: ATP-binding protein [Candidatus Omnitrophica bacterium]|nr:ATP-binding protein [Candidatus Omnitrophota bacterium]